MAERARPSGTARRTPRLSLPAPRALVGGALVVAAATTVLVAHRTASAAPTTRFVVAARDIQAGRIIEATDLGTLAMDLPDGMAAVPAADATDLVGRTAVTDLSELDLVRTADLADRETSDPDTVEVSVLVDPARAPADLQTGRMVTVLTTDPAEGTRIVLRRVPVRGVDQPDGTVIGGSDGVRVRVAAPDETAAADLVDASVRGELTLVVPGRTEGGRSSDG
jgi:hypothetical protein